MLQVQCNNDRVCTLSAYVVRTRRNHCHLIPLTHELQETQQERKYNFPIQSNLSFQKTSSNLPSNSGNFLQFAPLLNTQLI